MEVQLSQHEAYKLYKKYKRKYKQLFGGAQFAADLEAQKKAAQQQQADLAQIRPPLQKLRSVCEQPELNYCKDSGILAKCGDSVSCRQMYNHINSESKTGAYNYRTGSQAITDSCDYSNKVLYKGMGQVPRKTGSDTCKRVVKAGGAEALANAANQRVVEIRQQQQQQQQQQQAQQEAQRQQQAEQEAQQQQQAKELQATVATNQSNLQTNPLLATTSGQDRADFRINQLADQCSSTSSVTDWSESDCDSVLENTPDTHARKAALQAHANSLRAQQREAELQQQAVSQQSNSSSECDIDTCSTTKQNKRDIERLQLFQAQLTTVPEIQRSLLAQTAGKTKKKNKNREQHKRTRK